MSKSNNHFFPEYRFPVQGWCWLSQLLVRDEKSVRDSMLSHIREYEISVKKYPNDYLVNVEEFVSKTPIDRGRNG